jgi:hypothetical protein
MTEGQDSERELGRFLRAIQREPSAPQRTDDSGGPYDFNDRRWLRPDTQHASISFNLGANPRQAITNAAKVASTVGQIRAAASTIEREFGVELTDHEVTLAMRSAKISPLVSSLDQQWQTRDTHRLLRG